MLANLSKYHKEEGRRNGTIFRRLVRIQARQLKQDASASTTWEDKKRLLCVRKGLAEIERQINASLSPLLTLRGSSVFVSEDLHI
ncbi:hypothetical protein A7K93_04950 [Candidatus Methylacidiphilum fumarolicum]|nr:hypothetical protein A7K73_06925 [Candidatus Methylacidiphilum fumarolicum]TFE74041.1 hypothetical protein A7K93_04950 [Candidatus Methylacidiphilum fumarolicum]TFE74149.1 hypothetical protein A7D33_02095 [Candidatus Methylacidiphilum fumarolicum]TFE74932.1 hypothetical protein A7K72_02845 [Candidatus Methylacidiphilum fumarolicum]